jgi:hypothetical protein
MSDRLEGWSYPLDSPAGNDPAKLLDHTFVKAPENGPAFFDCFGGHTAAGAHALDGAAGNGYYAVANCYRLPANYFGVKTTPDTAGLGVYATRGVCHQAANRFLWSACTLVSGPTIHNAQGYILSWSFYGTYGRPMDCPYPAPCYGNVSGWIDQPPADFVGIYAGCSNATTTVAAEPPSAAAPPHVRAQARIIALHKDLHAKKQPPDHNAVADAELKILADEHLGPAEDVSKIREIRGRVLNRAHIIATSDLRGKAFADEVNAIGVQYLDEMEAHLGPERYSKLLRMTPKERFALVDPQLAETAGTRGTKAPR